MNRLLLLLPFILLFAAVASRPIDDLFNSMGARGAYSAEYSFDDEPSYGQVFELPGFGKVEELQYAGYLPVKRKTDEPSQMYYWFFESLNDPANDPTILWLQGGPGGSSLGGLFIELGPYKINKDDLTLSKNPYSWHKKANMLFIDNPVGTGFSYTKSDEDYCEDEDEVADGLFQGLVQFFLRYPKYQNAGLYIFGESYAGKYIPAISNRILDELDAHNPNATMLHFKGVGIGDGWYDPGSQTQSFTDFGFNIGMIDELQKKDLDISANQCRQLVDDLKPEEAEPICQKVQHAVPAYAGKPNVYDIRTFSDYDMSMIDRYLQQPAATKALYGNHRYGSTSGDVSDHLDTDIYRSMKPKLARMMERVRTVIFQGQFDYLCNLIGVENLFSDVDWDGHIEFKKAEKKLWKINGNVAGYSKTARQFTFLVAVGGGHLYPMDQPENALEMVDRVIHDIPFDN